MVCPSHMIHGGCAYILFNARHALFNAHHAVDSLLASHTAHARQSRTLLFTATDEFGNVVDPSTGKIISVAGGHTPLPFPPWLDQTPAILQWMNRTRTRLTETRLYKTVFSSRVEAEGAG